MSARGLCRTFLFSGYTKVDDKAYLSKMISDLGGIVLVSEYFTSDCTHIIATPISRTEKCLSASAAGAWILPVDYVFDSYKAGHWLPEESYEYTEERLGSFYPPAVCKLIRNSARRNRVLVQDMRKKRFHGWKCFICLVDKTKQKVYKWILKCGGAHVLTNNSLQHGMETDIMETTHVFTELQSKHSLPCSLPENCLYLHVDYLRNYLLRDPIPAPEEFLVHSYLQSNDPLSNMRLEPTKRDSRPNYPWLEVVLNHIDIGKWKPQMSRTCDSPTPQRRLKRTFPRNEDNENQYQWMDMQSSGVKRYITIQSHQANYRKILNLPIIQMSRRNLFGTHFERERKSVEKEPGRDDDPDPSELPSALCNMVDTCMDETSPTDALNFLLAALSPQWYPPARIVSTIFSLIMESEDSVCREKAKGALTLLQVSHPPKTRAVSNMYLNAILVKDGMDRLPWDFFSRILKKCISQGDSHCIFLFSTLVNIVEEDFKHFLSRIEDPSRELSDVNHYPLICYLFWVEPKVGTVSKNCKDLFEYLSQSLKKDDILPAVQRLFSLVLECVRLSGMSSSNQRESSIQTSNCEKFASEFINHFTPVFREKALVRKFLSSLNTTWFQMMVSEILLESIPSIAFTVGREETLSLRKIVTSYMIPEVVKGLKKNNSRFSHLLNLIDGQESKNEKTKSVNDRNKKGETKVHEACMKNKVNELQNLLNIPGVDVNAADNAGWTPLHEACNRGRLECVKLLLQWKPHPDFVSSDKEKNKINVCVASKQEGITPLHDAVSNDHVEIAELLLKFGGAKLLDKKDKKGYEPIHYAKSEEMKQILICYPLQLNDENQDTSFGDDYVSESTSFSQTRRARDVRLSVGHCSDFLDYLSLLAGSYMSWNCLYQMVEAWSHFSKLYDELRPDLVSQLYEAVHGIPPANDSVVDILYDDLCIIKELPDHLKSLELRIEKLTGKSKKTFVNELLSLEIKMVC